MDKKKIAAIVIGVLALAVVIVIIAVAANSESKSSKETTTVDNVLKANLTEALTEDEATTAGANVATNKTYGGDGDCYANDIFTDEAEENKNNKKKEKPGKSDNTTTNKSEKETTGKSNNNSDKKDDDNVDNPNSDKGWSDWY